MTLLVPEEQREENLKLIAEAYVDLFEFHLYNGSTLYLKNNETVEWQGHRWEGYPIILSGYEINTEKLSRPSMKVVNPEGVFSSIFVSGDLEKARISRYRVLRKHIDEDKPVYQHCSWILWRVTSITKNYAEFELRNPMDGNNFITPGRQYLPPEFPSVTLY